MKIGWVRTFTGRYVNVVNPEPSMICLEDVAHHLSIENRWGGASRHAHSVGTHSIWVARFVRLMVPQEQVTIATLYALLHDAHEAYVKDFPTPVKRLFPEFEILTGRLDVAIWASFGLQPPSDFIRGAIHDADSHVAWCEAEVLLAPCQEVVGKGRPPIYLLEQTGVLDGLQGPRAAIHIEQSFLSWVNSLLREQHLIS